MIRFAVAVTAVELALTLGAALFIAVAETEEPYVSQSEFEMLGLPVEKYSIDRRSKFGSLFSFETHAVLRGPGPAVTVSRRVNAQREEFDSRLAGERWPKLQEGDEAPVVTDESWPEEPGYAVRQRGRNGVRSELVRLRGKDMLVVRTIRMDVPSARAGEETSACERIGRLILEHQVQKLGWREGMAR